MYKELRPEQVEILIGSPTVNDEFSRKVKELDRRLKANGMSYRDWDILNDRQHDIFSSDMFLDGECATSVKDYVHGAVDSCWCPDVVEDLEHHSPALMREIEKQQDMLPDIKVKIGESLNNLNSTIDLLLEQVIQEVSRKGVAHEDKVGRSLTNTKTGDTLTLVDFKHIFKEQGQEKEEFFNAVQNVLSSATPPIPIAWTSNDRAESLRSNNNVAVIVVAQDDKGEKQAFVKFQGNKTLWREVDFGRETGWSIKGAQASRENLAFGPKALIQTESPIDIDKLGELVINNASGQLPQVFVESLPPHFESLYAKSNPPALKFEDQEQRNQSLPSVKKYFGEVIAPMILGKRFMLQPDRVLEDAKENLLTPMGISDWTAATAVSYPEGSAHPLVDSYLHFGGTETKIGVSSKSGTGADPSVKNLYTMLFEEADPQQLQEIRDAGYDDYVGLIEILHTNSMKLGPIRAAVEFDILSESEAEEAIQFIKDNPELSEARPSERLNELSSGHGLTSTGPITILGIADLVNKGELKVAGSYRPANHLIAGIAKTLAKKINAEKLNGLTKITQFARAAYRFSNMVQIYGKYTPSGETDVEMEDFSIVWPPRFEGEILLNAGKGYTTAGQNDKIAIGIRKSRRK